MTIEEMHHEFKIRINRFDANYFEDLTPDVIDSFLNRSVISHLEDNRYRHLWDMLRERKQYQVIDRDTGLEINDVLRFVRVSRIVGGKEVAATFEGDGSTFFSRHYCFFKDGLMYVSHPGLWVFEYIRHPRPVFVGGYRSVSHYYGDGGYDADHPPVDLELPDIEGLHLSVVENAVLHYINSLKLHLS